MKGDQWRSTNGDADDLKDNDVFLRYFSLSVIYYYTERLLYAYMDIIVQISNISGMG